MPDRIVRYSSEFDESITQIKKRDPSWIKRIKKTVEKIITYPDNYDHPLVGEKNYKLNKYVSLKGYRILYRFCNYCISHNQQNIETCDDCAEVRNHGEGIMFLDIFRRNLATTPKKVRKTY